MRPIHLEMHRLATRAPAGLAAGILLALVVAGCKDLTGSQQLPSGTTNPSYYNTPQGALLERNAAMVRFSQALNTYIFASGLLSDELQDANTDAGQGTVLANGSAVPDPLDERLLDVGSGGGSSSYTALQGARAFASQAIGMLATYHDTVTADRASQQRMQSELYSLTGYAEIMLADLFCSGVPLSTLDFQRDFTYRAGSNTADVYRAAIAQFDTALMLADTSTQMQNLARVGRGRAWLNLGQYDSAAAAVQAVPGSFLYQISSGDGLVGPWDRFQCGENCIATVSDVEGQHGFDYISSGDPRSAVTATFVNPVSGDTMKFPTKYITNYPSVTPFTVTVASSVEARLIQAEAAYHGVSTGTGDWLVQLNALRESIGLSDTTDPGTAAGRAALIFRERAEWLFLTGHRQGDMRRQLHQYAQIWSDQAQVYPTGIYTAPGAGRYGTDTNAPIPASESVNPLFHGCLSRDP